MASAKLQDVLEVKFGMEQLVHVKQVLTGMEHSVFSVSMDKNGMRGRNPVFAPKDNNGMETSARNLLLVEEEEFTIETTNNVCAQKEITGMDTNVLKSPNVAADKNGMKKLSFATAPKTLTGMEELVCFVDLGRHLIQ